MERYSPLLIRWDKVREVREVREMSEVREVREVYLTLPPITYYGLEKICDVYISFRNKQGTKLTNRLYSLTYYM